MQEGSRWLLLVFTLPTSKASERVQIWRKLQRFGAIAFRNAGSLLPNTPENQERFEWLARTIRASHGEASILQIQAIDDLPFRALEDQFRDARVEDYTALIEDLKKLKPTVKGPSSQVQRLRRRFEDVVAIDFFTSPLRAKVEEALTLAERTGTKSNLQERGSAAKPKYQKRTWITRPRPGIDRVSSAWLISRFIDAKPKFIFGTNPAVHKMRFRLTCSRVSVLAMKATGAPLKRYASHSIYPTTKSAPLSKRYTMPTWKTESLDVQKDIR